MNSCTGVRCGHSSSDDNVVVERDPSGRFLRFEAILGQGAFKTVYKGFDEVEGKEIAWNQVKVEELLQTPEHLERLYSEVHILKSVDHENIIKFRHSWVDEENKTINLITELFTSGSLRRYRMKFNQVDMNAIKSWARQILQGLHYLHSQSSRIIHRDLKCDNIFVNGHTGEVKIGDLGLAIVMQKPDAHSVIGTPEFMAPEIYDEHYNELVDIYSFGMCVLEMVTLDYPYCECRNAAQIFKKVTSGIKPASLLKIDNPEVRQFIEKCLAPASIRLSASDLLKDPFLATENLEDPDGRPLRMPSIIPTLVDSSQPVPHAMDIDSNSKKHTVGSCVEQITNTSSASPELWRHTENNEFCLKGVKDDGSTISLTLRICNSSGRKRNIHFAFYLNADTATSIALEMVEQLDLSAEDVTVIAELIDDLLVKLVPNWKASSRTLSTAAASSVGGSSHTTDAVSLMSDEDYVLAMLADGEIARTDDSTASYVSAEYGTRVSSDGALESYDGLNGCIKEISYEEANFGDSLTTNETTENSALSYDSWSDLSRSFSLSSMRSLSLGDRNPHDELNLEIEAIDSQYHQCCLELLKMREQAIECAKKRWMTKKKTAVA